MRTVYVPSAPAGYELCHDEPAEGGLAFLSRIVTQVLFDALQDKALDRVTTQLVQLADRFALGTVAATDLVAGDGGLSSR